MRFLITFSLCCVEQQARKGESSERNKEFTIRPYPITNRKYHLPTITQIEDEEKKRTKKKKEVEAEKYVYLLIM